MDRSVFFKQSFLATIGMGSLPNIWRMHQFFGRKVYRRLDNVKTSLNAYSFNSYLQNGQMDLDDLIIYCSKLKLDAVDITGYYFPDYPSVPSDDYIYHIKQKAFINGLAISGTGIRNNFIDPDLNKRSNDIELVKKWIVLASKLGAPVIRVFAAGGGQGYQSKYCKATNKRLIESLQECVEFGKTHGVMIGIQNHNNYLKNANQVLKIIEEVDSEWFGVILDVGSFSTDNPYNDIAKVAPHAISWQIKENLEYNNRIVNTNLKKIIKILDDVDYRGYIPIETLGGDPKEKVPRFLSEVINAMNLYSALTD